MDKKRIIPVRGFKLSVKEAAEQGRTGVPTMLDRIVEKARQQQVFSREDTSPSSVPCSFFVSFGLLYRRIEPFADRSYEAIRQWLHQLNHPFEPDFEDRKEIAVNETKVEN